MRKYEMAVDLGEKKTTQERILTVSNYITLPRTTPAAYCYHSTITQVSEE
jgi:hypothetical protein